eukprot:4321957-Pleurochrysis_carterae.AAC.1
MVEVVETEKAGWVVVVVAKAPVTEEEVAMEYRKLPVDTTFEYAYLVHNQLKECLYTAWLRLLLT